MGGTHGTWESEKRTLTTIGDVAREAGVSVMTASNALSGKTNVRPSTAAKVLAAARKLDYRPNLLARQLRQGRSKVIGFSTVELDRSPFSSSLASAVSDLALAQGYQTLIQQTRLSEAYESSMLSSISTQFTEGMILSAPSVPAKTIERVSERFPLVLFDSPYDGFDSADMVLTPCEDGACAAVNHLFDQGCERILVLGANPIPSEELASTRSSDGKRMRGASKAYADHDRVLDATLVRRCGWSVREGYEAMLRVLDDGVVFDGLFALSDVIAMGAVHALIARGIRVPQDVAVIGFDGLTDCEYSNPPLSSVAIDPKDVAKACLSLLLDRINDPSGHRCECRTVPFTLRIRESSLRGSRSSAARFHPQSDASGIRVSDEAGSDAR